MIAFLLTSCGSDQDDISETSDLMVSWAGSVRMTIDQWLREAIPDHFAQNTLARAQQELLDNSQALRESASSGGNQNDPVLKAVADLDAAVESLSNDLALQDRPRAAHDVAPLDAAVAALRSSTPDNRTR